LPKFLLEAMATGLAVATTDTTGCRQAVEVGVSGMLVPVRDVQALADALQQLIIDVSERTQMGIAGRKRALNLFSKPRVAGLTLEAYRDLLGTDCKS
jgi:glycosyltransferase involved in cell wall biosynthesis